MPFCTECGHENPSSAKFCAQCGHRLVAPESASETTSTISLAPTFEGDGETTELSAQDAAALDALPPGSALLVVQRGPSAGSRFLLDTDTVSAGRHPDSDIFLDDITVSRRHVEIRREGGSFVVHDAGSLNGTYLNRERVDTAPLRDGDELQIGTFKLVFLSGRGAP
jgi:pSer/pThr/pTyr-binding forkhead associated (FHA) protein